MPKNKTHSGAKKRFRLTGSGKVMRGQAGKRHLLEHKPSSYTRRVTGEFNDNNMLERTITWIPDPVLGDKMVEFRWSDYRDAGDGGEDLVDELRDRHPLQPVE